MRARAIVAIIGIVTIVALTLGTIAVCVDAGYSLAGAAAGFIVMLLGSRILASMIKAI